MNRLLDRAMWALEKPSSPPWQSPMVTRHGSQGALDGTHLKYLAHKEHFRNLKNKHS